MPNKYTLASAEGASENFWRFSTQKVTKMPLFSYEPSKTNMVPVPCEQTCNFAPPPTFGKFGQTGWVWEGGEPPSFGPTKWFALGRKPLPPPNFYFILFYLFIYLFIFYYFLGWGGGREGRKHWINPCIWCFVRLFLFSAGEPPEAASERQSWRDSADPTTFSTSCV